jgi:hypothetical protein
MGAEEKVEGPDFSKLGIVSSRALSKGELLTTNNASKNHDSLT